MSNNVRSASFSREDRDRIDARILEVAIRLSAVDRDREVSVRAVARQLLDLGEPLPSLAAADAAVTAWLQSVWMNCGSGRFKPK